MNVVKFIDDYVSQPGTQNSKVFERNSVWEYKDRYMTRYLYIGCEPCEEMIGLVYRIEVDEVLYVIPEKYVVCLTSEEIKNWDYTQKEWNEKITTDALVKDGNYVKAWMTVFGIDKPVKDRADQCDYDESWKRTARKIAQREAAESD